MIRKIGFMLFVFALLATRVLAEDVPKKGYKMDFVVKEVEGSRVLNSRTFSTVMGPNGCSVRSGSKYPVHQPGTAGVNYLDIGVNIDCGDVHEIAGELAMMVTADLTTVPPELKPGEVPVIRQNKWRSQVVIPVRKPTTVFSSDDLASRSRIQLEITATPLN